MKLSTYARSLGISYRTAWRWFKAGKIAGFQADTGTIIVMEPSSAVAPTAVYHLKLEQANPGKLHRLDELAMGLYDGLFDDYLCYAHGLHVHAQLVY